MMRWLAYRLNIWVFLVALVITGGLIGILVGLVYFAPAPARAENPPAMTVIPGPTPSQTPPEITLTPTAAKVVSVNGISVGVYVKISGTEGSGLRLRAGPGTNNAQKFLGMDEEVFQVTDGPKVADGYTWWFLKAPYDPNRTGWAAGDYLVVIQAPTQTP